MAVTNQVIPQFGHKKLYQTEKKEECLKTEQNWHVTVVPQTWAHRGLTRLAEAAIDWAVTDTGEGDDILGFSF